MQQSKALSANRDRPSMLRIFRKKKVILRQERSKTDYRYLGVEIRENGDLAFEGQDLGSGVEGAFGASEYEWYWTVKAQDIPKFQRVIGSRSNILKSLKKSFSGQNAAKLYEFMQDNEIPFESYSRVGD